jgi:hypothetical protein
MILIDELQITNNVSLKLLVPNVEDKYNYCFEPTDQLHAYDEITVILYQNSTPLDVAKNSLDFIIEPLQTALEELLNSSRNLPPHFKPGDIGRMYNEAVHYQDEADDHYFKITHFTLWNYSEVSVWLYKKNNIIYLEFSPRYPWLYWDPEEPTPTISFENFMKDYKPIALYELDRNTILSWLSCYTNIMQNVQHPPGYQLYNNEPTH